MSRSYYTNHLDHNVSVHNGFKNNIPPYIIGHWTNLRLIPAKENMKKSSNNDKTLILLFDDYFKEISD